MSVEYRWLTYRERIGSLILFCYFFISKFGTQYFTALGRRLMPPFAVLDSRPSPLDSLDYELSFE